MATADQFATMLFVRPGRLADALRTEDLSEVGKGRLLLAGCVAGAILPRGSLWQNRTRLELVLAIVYMSIFVGGLWSCYRENERADDRHFIERYVCLSVPIAIWTYGGYFLSYYVTYFVLRGRTGYDAASFPTTVRPYFAIVGIGVLALYFQLMRRYIRRAAVAPVAI